MHQLLFAVGGSGGLGARGRTVLFPVFVEVEGLADCGCVVVIGGLGVHAVPRAAGTATEVVGCEDEAVVGGGWTGGCSLNLQIQMMALRVVAARLLLRVRL